MYIIVINIIKTCPIHTHTRTHIMHMSVKHKTLNKIILKIGIIFQLYEMTIYTLYIFDRSGTCRHYSEWNRKNQSGLSIEEVNV